MAKYKFTENLIYSQFFSFEVLNYFDSIVTEENFEWIEKYFNVLIKNENKTAKKFEMHHIKPCCTFKDENHKTRKETKPLADKFNGNLIKLSVYNHIFAHFYLWKIFNIHDLKLAFQRMCGEGKYINNLTEDELKDVARLKEECAKKNQTEEEKKECRKQWYENNKEEKKQYYNKNKKEISNKKKNYRKNNKEKISKQRKKGYQNNKEMILKRTRNYNNEYCCDSIKKDACTRNALNLRKRHNKEQYKNVIVSECLITEEEYLKIKNNTLKERKENLKIYQKEWYKNNKERRKTLNKNRYNNNKEKISKKHKHYYKNNKEKISKMGKEYYKNNKEKISIKHKRYNSQLCFDPIEKDYCNLGTLRTRKRRHSEKYKDIIPQNCIIKNESVIS